MRRHQRITLPISRTMWSPQQQCREFLYATHAFPNLGDYFCYRFQAHCALILFIFCSFEYADSLLMTYYFYPTFCMKKRKDQTLLFGLSLWYIIAKKKRLYLRVKKNTEGIWQHCDTLCVRVLSVFSDTRSMLLSLIIWKKTIFESDFNNTVLQLHSRNTWILLVFTI